MGSGNIAQGCTPSHGCNVLVHVGGHFVANGVRMSQVSAFLMPPDSEFFMSVDGSHRWLSVFIPSPLMRSIGLEKDGTVRGFRDARVIGTRPGRVSRLWPLIDRFVHHASTVPEGVVCTESLASFQRELLAEINRLYGEPMPASKPTRGRPVTADRAAIATAVDYLESCPASVVPMAELVQRTRLSERTLRTGFQRYLGVSPTRYMQLRVLKVARQRLTASAPGKATVTQIAGELGLWDVGRFARRYREAFGELPSTTLGKCGRQVS
jgi:AraC family ethanolamine operon transcriptional activator